MTWIWKPWSWATRSNTAAVANARGAATELSRRRVERDEVALFLTERSGGVRPTRAG